MTDENAFRPRKCRVLRTDGSRKATRRALLAGALLIAAGARRSSASDNRPPLFYSQAGQFIMLRPRPRVPPRPIQLSDHGVVDLAGFAGRTVLVNFWAKWCAPCVAELPSLDRLAESLRGSPTVVLPIALDATDTADVAGFYATHGVTHLPILIDPHRRLGHLGRDADWHDLFPLAGLPTTYLIDPHGSVVGYVPGAAAWDTSSARSLIAWIASQ